MLWGLPRIYFRKLIFVINYSYVRVEMNAVGVFYVSFKKEDFMGPHNAVANFAILNCDVFKKQFI